MLCHEMNLMKYLEIWYQNLKSVDLVNPTWYADMVELSVWDPSIF